MTILNVRVGEEVLPLFRSPSLVFMLCLEGVKQAIAVNVKEEWRGKYGS